MISHAKKVISTGIFLTLALAFTFIRAEAGELVEATVLRVIDGDTVEISGGRRVRLVGIDAPEKGDLLSGEAAGRLRDLTASRTVVMDICDSRDKYGRILATVRTGGVNVNETLLREGLALPMLIPPCGTRVSVRILNAAGSGAVSGKGVYSLSRYRVISHEKAGESAGEFAVVKGKILEFNRTGKVWYFNFGRNWKTDFTAVVFRNGQARFVELGIDPAGFTDTEVLVRGKVRNHNGPQIILHGPDQIIPLEEITVENPKSKIQNVKKP
jgi:hypothetical protein